MSLLLLFAGSGTGIDPTDHPGDSTFPGLTFEIAFGYTWRDVPNVWTDVTKWVSMADGVTITSGRPDELQPVDASTLTFTLDNKDRRFDPSYAAGPHFGDVEPIVPVRVVANWAGNNYPLFYGFIEGWPQVSQVGNRESWLQITANDVLELLSQTDYSGGSWTLDDPVLGRLDSGNRIGGAGTLTGASGERIDAVLDLAGYPDAYRDIATGVAELSESQIDGTPRDAIDRITEAEGGWVCAGPDGDVVFLARNADRTVTRMAVSQGTFTDADFSLPYAGLRYAFDRKYVFNDVRRQRVDGEVQAAVDDDSIDRYFRRKHEVSDLPLASDSDAAALAGLFLRRHKDATLRPEPVVIDPGNNRTTLFPQVLGRRLFDRITVERTPQEIGDPIEGDHRIEGITHQIGLFTWQTEWPLSPVDDTTYWTLDDDSLGLLDSGNLIGA